MKILIAGDFCPKNRMISIIEQGNYDYLFRDIKSILSEADYSIVNFETCVANATKDKPISKCGPALCCSVKAIDALQHAGFNCCTLANNHFNDYGIDGIKKSLEEFSHRHMDYVGAGFNLKDAREILYKDIIDKKVAIINCCEHEFSIATETAAGCNPLDPISLYYDIQKAREIADYVIIIVHGGQEHLQVPQPRMKRLYRYFIDLGADVVVNHHQHCVNGMEIYHDKPIFYGLGNFCFDWEAPHHSLWNQGYMVMIDFSDIINYEIIPYNQCDEKPCVELMRGTEKLEFEKDFSKLSDSISEDKELEQKYRSLINTRHSQYQYIFEPYSGRIGCAMYFRNLLPSFVKKNLEMKINYIECESHRESLILYLRSLLKSKEK